ncbi:MAG: hypothetical protein AB8C02_07275 [Halioglobus sp.]
MHTIKTPSKPVTVRLLAKATLLGILLVPSMSGSVANASIGECGTPALTGITTMHSGCISSLMPHTSSNVMHNIHGAIIVDPISEQIETESLIEKLENEAPQATKENEP